LPEFFLFKLDDNGSRKKLIEDTIERLVNDGQIDELNLGVRYDAGFVAYLDGVQIAAANNPANPTWNSSASSDHGDGGASTFVDFDISIHINLLTAGQHLLAFHAMNISTTSSDFLLAARLAST